MKIICRAVVERSRYVRYLREHLPNLQIVWDTEHLGSYASMRLALGEAGADPVVLIEDDILLVRDFEKKIAEQITARPSEVIQFFSMRRADCEVGSRYDRDFIAALCFYLPAGHAQQASAWAAEVYDCNRTSNSSDLFIKAWLQSRRESYWICCPNLVQHRIGKSFIDPRRSSRRLSLTCPEADLLHDNAVDS